MGNSQGLPENNQDLQFEQVEQVNTNQEPVHKQLAAGPQDHQQQLQGDQHQDQEEELQHKGDNNQHQFEDQQQQHLHQVEEIQEYPHLEDQKDRSNMSQEGEDQFQNESDLQYQHQQHLQPQYQQDPENDSKYQERKNQIIAEQLGIYQNNQAEKRKFSKNQTDQLVHNLLQKGKEIEYKNNLRKQKFENEEVQECHFQPSSVYKSRDGNHQSSYRDSQSYVPLAQQKPSRNLQEFLKDQNKYLEKRDKNLKINKEKENDRQFEGYTGKPQLCQKSETILKGKNTEQKQRNQPTYLRLYNMNKEKQNQKQEQEKQRDQGKNIEKTQSQMQVQAAFQKNRIKEEAANRLYNDFKRREEKFKDSQQFNSQRNKSKEGSTMIVQRKNDYCLTKKLLKEFDVNIAILQKEYNKPLQILNYIQTSELLRLLHFTSEHTRVESANFIKERSLINDLWIILEGQKFESVTGRNLILALLGIMGIQIDIPKYKPSLEQDTNSYQNENETWAFNSSEQNQPQTSTNPTQIDKAIPLIRDSDQFEEQQQIRFQHQQNLKEQQQLQDYYQNQQGQQQEQQQFGNDTNNDSNDNQQYYERNEPFIHKSLGMDEKDQIQDNYVNYNPVDLQNQKQYSFQDMDTFYNQRSQKLIIGTYDEDRNLQLNEEDIKKLQSHFHNLYLTRLNHSKQASKEAAEKQSNPNQSKEEIPEQQSTVRMSQRNEQLAQNHRARMYEIARTSQKGKNENITNYDLLLAHNEIKEKNAQYQREQQKIDEMDGCSFVPQTLNYNSNKMESSSNSVDYKKFHKNQEPDFIPKMKNYKKPMPNTSLGAERYKSLYQLGKPRSQLRDKATDEIEYEKNCDECTFAPDLQHTRSPQGQKLQKSRQIDVRNSQNEVDRLRGAYQQKSLQKKFQDRGYDYYIDQNPDKYYSGSKMSTKRDSDSKMLSDSRNPQQLPGTSSYAPQQDKLGTYTFGKNQPHQQQPFQDSYDSHQKDHDNQMQDSQQNSNNPNNNNNNMYDQKPSQEQPEQEQEDDIAMLFVDVNLSADRVERIVVKKGDHIPDIADDFIRLHQLDENIKDKLIELLTQQINKFMDYDQQGQQQ